MATKWVYLFKEGSADMKNLLGGKGANLAEMTNLGLPIPQGRRPTQHTTRHRPRNPARRPTGLPSPKSFNVGTRSTKPVTCELKFLYCFSAFFQ